VPRNLTDAIAAEFQSQRLAPVLFVNLQFLSGWVYLWTGIGSVVWNGHTYYGIVLPNGTALGTISSLSESVGVDAQSMSLSLSGVPSTSVQQVLNECRQSFGALIYFGAMDIDTGEIIDSPFAAWGGTTDVTAISDSGATCTVTITVESKLVNLQRAPNWRYTDQDQQLFSAGDLGFAYVNDLQTASIFWGTGKAAGPQGSDASSLSQSNG
jgi:hypothetical protein